MAVARNVFAGMRREGLEREAGLAPGCAVLRHGPSMRKWIEIAAAVVFGGFVLMIVLANLPQARSRTGTVRARGAESSLERGSGPSAEPAGSRTPGQRD
jgi:hypothetical protein